MTATRINLGNGKWFCPETSEDFYDRTRWDGNNQQHVTGDQFSAEVLYLTRGKAWIKQSWTAWQGSVDTYDVIEADEALDWIARYGNTDAREKLEKLYPGKLAEVEAETEI